MKTLKKILSVVLMISMMVSALALSSCGKDKDDNKNDGANNNTNNNNNVYTVTVVDGDNNPVAGVSVMVSAKNYETLTTNSEGKITFESPNGGGDVMIMSTPAGYDAESKSVSFESGKKELTLTVTKQVSGKVTYTVTVKDQEGNPVSGVGVQMCPGGACMGDVPTNANGEATNEILPGSVVKIMLTTLPDGYTAPAADGEGYHAVIAEDATSIVITITKN